MGILYKEKEFWVMEDSIKGYKSAKKLALDIKLAINSHLSGTSFDLVGKNLSRDDLRDFLGKTLDNENNRKMAFSGGNIVMTMRDTIFNQKKNGPTRKKLFVELLKEYNPELYDRLLADLTND
jgi:hypothetical protein